MPVATLRQWIHLRKQTSHQTRATSRREVEPEVVSPPTRAFHEKRLAAAMIDSATDEEHEDTNLCRESLYRGHMTGFHGKIESSRVMCENIIQTVQLGLLSLADRPVKVTSRTFKTSVLSPIYVIR